MGTWLPSGRYTICSLLLLSLQIPGSTLHAAEPQPSSSQPSSRPATATQSLQQLTRLAREHYPGVEAARRAVAVMEAKLFRARWAWIPQGTVKGLLAPSPDRHCQPVTIDGTTYPCLTTKEAVRNDSVDSVSIAGIYGRIELELGMPVYTFDKLGAAKRAAVAGVKGRTAQVEVAQAKVANNVAKAYWGLKLAQELRYTVKEGRKHLVKAIDKVEKDLDADRGDVTEIDRLRLKTALAEVDSQLLEADKGIVLARATLAMLSGLSGPEQVRLDNEPLQATEGEPGELNHYLQLALKHRPEIKALDAASMARKAAVELERSRFYPDLLLVGMAGYGAATSVDDPDHGYYNDPFNFLSAGFGLAMRWKWDQVQQYGKYKEARAEAATTRAQKKEALAAIMLEVRKTHLDLQEAVKRLEATKKGARAARSWMVATVQSMEAGLSSPKDLVDSLVAYFSMDLKRLKAMYDVNVGWHELARVTGSARLAKAPTSKEK